MNTDLDRFAAELRAAIDVEGLSSGMDPERIVAVSRRKRRLHHAGAGVVITGCAAGAVLAIGPGLPGLSGPTGPALSDGFQPQAQPAAEDTTASVDPVAGTIVFPRERYNLTPAEEAEVNSAMALAMSRCADDRGVEVPWEPYDPAAADESSNRLYGVWVMAEAQEFGYDHPNSGLTGTAPGVEPSTDGDLAVFEACNQSPEVLALRHDQVQPSDAYLRDLRALNGASGIAPGLDSADAVQARAEWEECLAGRGLGPSGDTPWMTEGVGSDLGSEENRARAVIDVQCKSDVDLVQRLADAGATAEAPLIALHREELEAMRAEYEDLVERARDYLDTHAPRDT